MHVADPNYWLGHLGCMLNNLQLNGQCYTFRLDFNAHFKQCVTPPPPFLRYLWLWDFEI